MNKKFLAIVTALLLLPAAFFGGCGQTEQTGDEGGTITDPSPDNPDGPDKPDDDPDDPDTPDEPEMIEGMEVVPEKEVNTFSEENLRLFGRTYLRGAQLCLDNGGTGFEVTFYGTKLDVTMTPMTTLLYFRAFVDGETEGTLTKLTGNRAYHVAKDLPEGVHTVRIVKSISSQNGVIRVSHIGTDGKFLRAEKPDVPNIEFVGDSISVGAGIFGKGGEPCTVDNSDAAKSFAYLTAQALNADYSIVATEGICVKKTKALPFSMMEMYQRLSSATDAEYDYPEASHDLVVLALGTNDGFYMGGDMSYTQELFAEDYVALLALIRSKNPHAKIVCVYGMMGTNAKIEDGIKAALNTVGDETISYLPLPADLKGADSHPSLEGAEKQSETLLTYLKDIL